MKSRSGDGHRDAPDAAFIRTAVETADLNALRIALLHATGDEAYARMSVEQAPINGGSSTVTVLSDADRPAMIELAVRHLESPMAPSPPPDVAETKRLLELYAGRPVNEDELWLSIDQLDFTERAILDADGRRLGQSLPADFHVLIVGAGFGGVAAAIHLERLGVPYTMVDRSDGLGGTWRVNRYPDVRVDVPSHYYQFTFERFYPWKHRFAEGAEVREYIEHVATKHGVTEHFRPRFEVTAATWDDEDKRWEVSFVEHGRPGVMRPNVIISAAGLFNRPHIPNLEGLDRFGGSCFHTTAWPEDLDIPGKRVAVIGTGSTGAQLVPKIAQTAAHVTIFQRSPNWVAPVQGYHEQVSPEARWLLNTVPFYWNWFSFGSHWHSTQHLPGLQVHDPDWQAAGGRINERNDRLREFLIGYIREKLRGNEELIRKCIPDYAPWTRRMVMDNGWYDALMRSNVDLVTTPIDHVEEDAVIDRSGERYRTDVIVLSTGFATEQYLWPVDYRGRHGVTMAKAWEKDGARAHLGLAVPGFPNLFVLYGPNGQPRSGSITKWLEIWARYAADAIAAMVKRGARSIEVSKASHDSYNAAMDAEMTSLIWESAGKSSYYVNSHGRSSVNMPWTAEYYYKRSANFRESEYEFD